ncbi:MAG: PqqD family protein [Magnetococcales bacterium]|nr:PqqD family protein [Magnetococcales bacterium]
MFNPGPSTLAPPMDPVRLENLAISRNGYVFDPKSGQSFTVNATGLMALELLQGGATAEDTAMALSRSYGVAREVALGSVEGFIRQLARNLA